MQSSALHQGHSTSCANGREELAASAVLEINQAGTVVRENQVSANLHCKVNEMWGLTWADLAMACCLENSISVISLLIYLLEKSKENHTGLQLVLQT